MVVVGGGGDRKHGVRLVSVSRLAEHPGSNPAPHHPQSSARLFPALPVSSSSCLFQDPHQKTLILEAKSHTQRTASTHDRLSAMKAKLFARFQW